MVESVQLLETMKRNKALHATLRPLIFFTLYYGILPCWSNPQKIHGIGSTLSWVAVSSTMVLQIGMISFQVIQIQILFSKNPSIHSITFNIIWLIPSVTSLFIQMWYVKSAHSLVKFLGVWRKLGKSLISLDSKSRILLVRGVIYGITLFQTIATIISMASLINEKPEASSFLSYYSLFRRPQLISLTIGYHLWIVVLVKALIATSDLVPSFFFYHVSIAVRALTDEIESLHHPLTVAIRIKSGAEQIYRKSNGFSNRRIQSFRSSYKQLHHFVNKVNVLFGPAMIVSLAFKFCLVSLLQYPLRFVPFV